MYKSIILVLALASCTFAGKQKPNSEIVRPCQRVRGGSIDLHCVRDNLKANSRCDDRNVRSLPASYTHGKFEFETPYFNASYIDNDLVVKNHDKCYVSEFYFNVKKDVAVITVDCPNLILASNRTLIQHASFQEDKVYSYSSTWKYPMIRMTSNIKNANAINICNAFVFTDVVQLPTFVVTPNDKQTKEFLSHDLSFMNIYERETFFYRGFPLFRQYISTSVCNFGC